MTNATFPARAKEQAAAVARDGSPWIQWLARIGFAARSAVYTVVGLLAAKLALGDGGQTTDHVGAMRSLLRQPLGEVILGVLAVGFFGYALWRLVQAFVDPEHKGTGAKGIALRMSYAFRAAVYSVFGVQAVRMLTGDQVSGGGEKKELAARAMDAPAGPWLVGAIGAGLLGYALYQLYRAWKAKIDRRLALGSLSPRAERAVVGISRFGIAARGVVFGAAGVLFIRAALQHDPSEAGGVSESLRLLLNQPNGVWILATVSIGLIAYGVYQALEARYRHIEVA
ncbi:MAG TPA: DUF1206 domain-containing protein [Gemmatimonadaceae bacterium]|nr:DUF1206 domain-containing protein [Gemmatimonadaceae bacterium]